MTNTEATNTEATNPYDDYPYPHLTHSNTHPEHMETLGTMLGLEPAPVNQCRVLELGAAAGFNLFPMAYAYPDSRFMGIDYSSVQIDFGLNCVKELGFTNVDLKCLDVMDITPDLGEFDYIIAHGLYSWVPQNVRDQIMAVCKGYLKPQGIAYISYNTYPGWALMGMLRGMMQYRVRDIDEPMEKADEARKLVEFLSGAVGSDNSAYGAYLTAYLDIIGKKRIGSRVEDNRLLLHDELEEFNDPVFFYQFVEHASSYGLQYLVESDFSDVLPTKFPAEVSEQLRAMSRDLVEMEQYLDFLKFRTFRRTLLCHQGLEINRTFSPKTIYNLHLQSRARIVTEKPEDLPENLDQFRGMDGANFTTDHPLTIEAFKHLRYIFPMAISFIDLIKECLKSVTLEKGESIDEHAALVAANFLRAYSYSDNLVEFHLHPAEVFVEISEKPEASMIARWQLDHMVKVTNMRHERVELDDFSRCLLRHLDGTNDHEELMDLLSDDRQEGRFDLEGADINGAETKASEDPLENLLNARLRYFALAALLVS
jgi:methyltransferase-like protein